MAVEIKYEVGNFKKGNIVVSNKAAKGHQTPFEIEYFLVWDDEIEVRLKNNQYKWTFDCLELYKKNS